MRPFEPFYPPLIRLPSRKESADPFVSPPEIPMLRSYELKKDPRGMTWDLLLYVPTVSALSAFAANAWYASNPNLAYLLLFMACFFLFAGANRVLKTRLLYLPTAPVRLEADPQAPCVRVHLKNGTSLELLKDIHVYRDYSGRSIGLTGLDAAGKRLQFVFHKGQFSLERDYQSLQDFFAKKKAPLP